MGTVVAGGRFELTGSPAQNEILLPVFTPGSPSYIAFPWVWMGALPSYPVPIGWDDLNDGTMSVRASTTGERQSFFPHDDEGHAIVRPGWMLGESDQRFMIAGVFWTDGRIKIDVRMEARPDDAREVLSAELAHAVDYGLPLTDAMKAQLVSLVHPGSTDAHTWWEQADYGSEYYTLVGESFMALFTHAYSKMVPWQDPFLHKSTKELAARVPEILGVPPVGRSGAITLAVRAWRTTFGNGRAELTWKGASGSSVTVHRNGARLMTTANDGVFRNNLAQQRGQFRYQLVDSTGVKSNVVTADLR